MRESYRPSVHPTRPLTPMEQRVLSEAEKFKTKTGESEPPSLLATQLDVTRQRIGQVSRSLRKMGYQVPLRTLKERRRHRKEEDKKRRAKAREYRKTMQESQRKTERVADLTRQGYSSEKIGKKLKLTQSAVQHRRVRLISVSLLEPQKSGPKKRKRI